MNTCCSDVTTGIKREPQIVKEIQAICCDVACSFKNWERVPLHVNDSLFTMNLG